MVVVVVAVVGGGDKWRCKGLGELRSRRIKGFKFIGLAQHTYTTTPSTDLNTHIHKPCPSPHFQWFVLSFPRMLSRAGW